MHMDKNGKELLKTLENMSWGKLALFYNILGGILGLLLDFSDVVFCVYKYELALLVIYIIINCYKSKKREEKERKIQERELIGILKARIGDLIRYKIVKSKYFKKFIDGIFKKFSNDYGEWPEPRQYDLSDKILEPLQLILEDEYDEEFSMTNIRMCVENRLETVKQQLFNASFDSLINMSGQYSDEDFLDRAVLLYCDVFGEDDSFIGDLENYINEKISQPSGDENTSYYLRNTLDNEIERRKKKQKVEMLKQKLDAGIGVVEAVTISQIDVLKGLDFEKIVGALYENMGYKATVTKGSGDQGGDVVVEKYGLRTVVQAKRYDGSVGNKAVQEAVASKAYYDCEEAIVITNNHFTKAARVLAEVNDVKLIEREELISLLEKYPIVP